MSAPDARAATRPISSGQHTRLHAALSAVGLTARPDKMRRLGELLGREVTSSRDLTYGEASQVINALRPAPEAGPADPAAPAVPPPGDPAAAGTTRAGGEEGEVLPPAREPLVITAHGNPVPQGSKTRTRHGMRDDSSEKLQPWRDTVHWAALRALDGEPAYEGPVVVEVTFTLRKPAAAPKTRTSWPVKPRTGDLDKLQRAVFDALTDAAVWGDDAQVVEVTARKVYPEEGVDALEHPGALIRVWQVAS